MSMFNTTAEESTTCRLTREDHWGSSEAQKGFFRVDFDGGNFCLLVPDSRLVDVSEIRTGKHAIITMGVHLEHHRTMYELLFEDGSKRPFVLCITPDMFERPISMKEAAGTNRQLIVYEREYVEVARMPVYFRETETLPCLKPWTGKTHADARPADETSRREIERLTRLNETQSNRIRLLQESNGDLTRQLGSAANLRTEVNRLNSAASSKDARIKALEGEVAAITDDIEHRVSSQVADVRKAAEDHEYHALQADEQRDAAQRAAEKADRRSKRLERLLFKHGINPMEAFVNDARDPDLVEA